jgi:hypothetical protein
MIDAAATCPMFSTKVKKDAWQGNVHTNNLLIGATYRMGDR